MINLEVNWGTAASLLPIAFTFTAGMYLLLSLQSSKSARESKLKLLAVAYLAAGLFVLLWEEGSNLAGSHYDPLLALPLLMVLAILYYSMVNHLTGVSAVGQGRAVNNASPQLLCSALPLLVLLMMPTRKLWIGTFFWAAFLFILTRQLYCYYRQAVQREDANKRHYLTYALFLLAFSSLLPLAYFHPAGHLNYSIVAVQTIALALWIGSGAYKPYLLLSRQEVEAEEAPVAKEQEYAKDVSRQKLENYFKKEKPYLNSTYRMEDLQEALQVKRHALSSFINQTYQMNFNCFMNKWRMETLQELRKHAKATEQDEESLLKRAGFSGMRHYLRAKSQFDTRGNV
ncbi:MAG: hypothetical protein LBL81_04810 [Tannerella sp.]|jgi:hypothetical protein|nr:hypothetical protein [Tannerella sp.]